MIRVRCDQNRRFGCGKVSEISATVIVIGLDRHRVLGGGPCQHCGLPLARYRDATADEVVQAC